MATYKLISGDYNIQTSNVLISGNVVVANDLSANVITANYFIGDGQFLTGVTANIGAASILQNGTSNVNIPAVNGNITFGVNFAGNVVVVSTQGISVNTGTVSTSNVTGAIRVTGGVGVAGNVYADAVFSNNLAVLNVNSVINGGTY